MGYDENLISENKGQWSLVSETKNHKVGLICNNPIQCKLSINIGTVINNYIYRNKINESKINNKMLFVIGYLKSYQYMGQAILYVDNNRNTLPNMATNYTSDSNNSIYLIDALDEKHHDSPIETFMFKQNIVKANDSYLHFMITNSKPKRKSNKFKLVSIFIDMS